jgi:hypothetical protein
MMLDFNRVVSIWAVFEDHVQHAVPCRQAKLGSASAETNLSEGGVEVVIE